MKLNDKISRLGRDRMTVYINNPSEDIFLEICINIYHRI